MTSGHLVICVDATPPRTSNCAPRLEAGATYTVLQAVRRSFAGQEFDGLILEEARFSRPTAGPEHGWLARRFMPIPTPAEGDER